MKTACKLISLTLTVLTLIMVIVGCGSRSGSNGSITTSSAAISAVKNYLSGTSFSLEHRVAGALNFYIFYEPQYDTCSAAQSSNGSWDVTIKGSMSGYVDEHRKNIESYKFQVSATVSKNGNVKISVQKAY